MLTTVSVSNRLDTHHIGQLFRASMYHFVLLVLACGIANQSQSLALELKEAVIVPVLPATNLVPLFINDWFFVGLLPPLTFP